MQQQDTYIASALIMRGLTDVVGVPETLPDVCDDYTDELLQHAVYYLAEVFFLKTGATPSDALFEYQQMLIASMKQAIDDELANSKERRK